MVEPHTENPMQTASADFTLEDHGSIVLVRPLTDEARHDLETNSDAESWQWLGGALAIDHRMARAFINAAVANGRRFA